jgi:hypothetical protein
LPAESFLDPAFTSSEVDNESYDFNLLKNSDLTTGWTLP